MPSRAGLPGWRVGLPRTKDSRSPGAQAPCRRPRRGAAAAASDAPAGAEAAAEAGVLRVFAPHGLPRFAAPPGAPALLILPGFANCADDYETALGRPDAALAPALRRRGFDASVLPLARADWLRVARMALSPAYWRQQAGVEVGYGWYLDAVEAAVAAAAAGGGDAPGCDSDPAGSGGASGGAPRRQVVLVGHSAGGWLARAFLGRRGGAAGPHDAVRGLVTLGAPHRPPPRGRGAPRDATGGALRGVDARWPGAHCAGVAYVCVAGRAVRGDPGAPRRSLPGYAAGAYREVCGDARAEGDAVVPLAAAALPGARRVELDGVFHSVSRVGSFGDAGGHEWYGSEAVVDAWLHAAGEEGCFG